MPGRRSWWSVRETIVNHREPEMKVNVRTSMVVVAAILVGACGKKQPPPAPVPQSTSQNTSGPAPTNNSGRGMESDNSSAEAARNRATLAERIHFAYDQSMLNDAAQTTLRAKVSVLRGNPSMRIRIEGHADERGSVEYNLALGLRRAQSAKEFLVGFGVDASRIDIETYGEDRPMERGMSESAYAANRRDEFVIVTGR
jgi:peptidoglycan-associated lipoprotein